MKKLVTLSVATLAVAGFATIGAVNASALNGQGNRAGNQSTSQHVNGQGNGYQSSLESRAKVVGMTADELSKALETKTMSQIAVEKGLSEDAFRAKMTEAAKARWEARGLSDETIAQRMADREQRHATNEADHEFGSGDGNHQGGYGKNR